MGKRKRPKKKPLTQEEIWDDSALVQSWDDAVEEYNVWNPSCTWCNAFLTRFVSRQLYHSIQARGESVDEVLRAEDARIRAEDEAAFGEHAAEDPPHAHPVAEFESVDEEANDQDMEMEAGTDSHGAQQEASSAKKNPEANRTAGGGFATMPQLVSQGDDASSKFLSNYLPHVTECGWANIGLTLKFSGADKALKNLMMAWYFAGYYTGLYEGQQRGANQHSWFYFTLFYLLRLCRKEDNGWRPWSQHGTIYGG